MGSIMGHRIDYNGAGASESPAAHTQQKLIQVPPLPKVYSDQVLPNDTVNFIIIVVYRATKRIKYFQGTRVNKHMVRTNRTTGQGSRDPYKLPGPHIPPLQVPKQYVSSRLKLNVYRGWRGTSVKTLWWSSVPYCISPDRDGRD